MKTYLKRTPTFLLPLITSFIATSAHATPRLAATYGQDCQLCHVNPSGAGMRNSYVTSFMGPAELPLKPLPAHEQSRWPKAKLNDQISVGTDLRLRILAMNNSQTADRKLDNTFHQIQADFYLAFEPDPQFVLYLEQGYGSESEVFALGRILPWHGYLKCGQFVPDVGWREDDINRYTRERANVGVEVGLAPGAFSLTAGLYNANLNSQKMFVAKMLHRQRLGPVNTAIGASTRWNHGAVSKERSWGILAQAGWDKFAYIGDFFGQRNEPYEDPAVGLALHEDNHTRTWSWIMSQEIDYRPMQGLDVYFGYDFFDPDLDHEDGTQYQLSLGSRIYLRHFLKLEPIFRYERETTATTVVEDKRLEIVIHAFY